MKFYDREPQIEELHRIQDLSLSDFSRMTVVTGRRRIGKTSLITEAMRRSKHKVPTLYLFVSRKNEAALCRQFAEEATQTLGSYIPPEVSSFGALFRMLLEIAKTTSFNLILDEFQEFDSINRSIFSDMQNYWDQYRRKSKMNLLISGSVYTLMHKIFQDHDEPLFGRADNILHLAPFSISTLTRIMKDHNSNYSNDDLLALFTITGGVPKYVELLCDSKALAVNEMLKYASRENSPFIEEGRNLLITEFGKNYGTYFSVLEAVSEGSATQHDIEQTTGQKAVGGYIRRLTEDYQLLAKVRPILSKKTSQTVRYEISDNFLCFWFAYFEKNRPLIELGNFSALFELMKSGYPAYSGLMLERYFKKQLAESGEFRDIGSWWESKGNQNEIDIVALRLEKNKALAVEVKRKQENFRMSKLEKKVQHLKHKAMPKYDFELKCLSLEDMSGGMYGT